jgi:DNA-binding response OmpR family regulator
MTDANRTRPTLLICDDDDSLARALAREAERLGLEPVVDTTSDQVEALAQTHQPAVILLDVNQKQDGRDLLAQLKKSPRTRHAKVVMLSGRDDEFLRSTCIELGAEDYEVKPPGPIFMRKIARMAGLPLA